jgi:hypothetical protein
LNFSLGSKLHWYICYILSLPAVYKSCYYYFSSQSYKIVLIQLKSKIKVFSVSRKIFQEPKYFPKNLSLLIIRPSRSDHESSVGYNSDQ